MATTYTVNRTISARPETVWELLSDADSYGRWNRAVVSIEGPIAEGRRVRLVSVANPKRTFSPKVAELTPPRRMVWRDGMPLGLFTGQRTYSLNPTGDGGTDFTMEETFTGLMAPLITKSIPDLTESFTLFADGLKTAAEEMEARAA